MHIGLFYVFTTLFWGAIYAYTSFLTPYALRLGAGEAMVGTILGAYGLSQLLLRIPLGIFSDKLRRRKPFLLLGVCAALAGALGMWFFPSANGLLIFRLVFGIAAATWVVITVLFSSYFDSQDAPKAIGKLQTANTLGIMLASVTGAQLAQRMGEPSAFLLSAGLALLALVIGIFLKEKRPEVAKPLTAVDFAMVGANPFLLSVAGCGMLLQVINLATANGFTQQWAQNIGMSTGELGYLSLCLSIPSMIASLLCGTYLTRYIKPHIILVMGAIFIATAVSLIPFTTAMPQLLALQCLHGFGSGLMLPMLMGLSIVAVPNEKRGAAMGFYQSIYALGMTVGPVIAGTIIESFTLRTSFWLMGGVGVILALLCAFLLRRKPG